MSPTSIRDDVAAAAERLQRLLDRARELEIERAPAGSDLARRHPVVDLCAALLRMRVRPALAGPAWEQDPVHVSVFGGTNTGKSTVLNVLLGRAACGMKVTARFSQHPEAWSARALGDFWRTEFSERFRGYAVHRGETPPRQSDTEIAQSGWHPALGLRTIEESAAPELVPPAGPDAVFWDAPDFSTEEAQAWLPAVLDTVALSDVVLFVATDESYADDRGIALLELVAATGSAVLLVANKVGAESGLLADVRAKLARAGATHGVAGPFGLPLVEGADPEARLARLVPGPEAAALRAAVTERAAPGTGRAAPGTSRAAPGTDRRADGGPAGRGLKHAVLAGSLRFLDARIAEALEPLRSESRVAARWSAIVDRTSERELCRAYREEYLDSRRYQEFGQALLEVMRLLEVPGIGPVVSAVGRVVRMPLGLVRKAWSRAFGAADERGPGPTEERVVARLFKAWLAALRSEAQTLSRAEDHPGWARLARAVDAAGFQEELVQGFQEAYRTYRADLDARVAESAQRIYAKIRENPKLLAGLRAANFFGDAGVTISAVAAGGLSPTDLLLGPLVHGLWEELVERGLGTYIERQQEVLKREQLEAVRALFESHLSVPVRALFTAEFDPTELERAHEDWALVRGAAETTPLEVR